MFRTSSKSRSISESHNYGSIPGYSSLMSYLLGSNSQNLSHSKKFAEHDDREGRRRTALGSSNTGTSKTGINSKQSAAMQRKTAVVIPVSEARQQQSSSKIEKKQVQMVAEFDQLRIAPKCERPVEQITPQIPAAKVLCCDKCDGKHETENCPYFKKKREDHPDAQRRSAKDMGGTSTLPGAFVRNGRVVRQPGDGSCLFHSMSYGLRGGYNATRLRSEICTFIQNNPNFQISDTPLKDWVKWDSNGATVQEYARKMSRGSWGGGIEMACASNIFQCNVHVYERYGTGYKRISAFDCADRPETRTTIRVLYGGGVHYDALLID